MRKTALLLLFLSVCTFAWAQPRRQKNTTANTIAVSPRDDHDAIIRKAVQVIPTANQYAALKNEFIAFIHFGPNTFTRMEWGTGKEDPAIFDLKELHTDQWCEALKAAGMKMVIITAKHHDGFVLWQSRYTKHGIMSSPYKNGKGDILKELAASCRKYGLKLGIYLSPADLFQIESAEGLYGNRSRYTERVIPRAVPGRPFANKRQFRFFVDDYNEYFLNQLFELLTEYGTISEVWFDGAHPKTKGGQQYVYEAWRELIRTLAPGAVIFGREDVRWCGNEAGKTRATEWNVIPYQDDPRTMNHFSDLTDESLGAREDLYKGRFLHYQPAETNTSIREGWFYRDDVYQKVRNADDVFDIYERATGGNSIFLLNIPPNREGKLPDADVASLRETGRRIRDTYSHNLFAHASANAALLDGNAASYQYAATNTPVITITTPRPVTINRIVLQEAIATHGERVEQHSVDAWIDGRWKEIAAASNIGYKRILRFPDVTASRFRVRITGSRAAPAISTVAAYRYVGHAPSLAVRRDVNGYITIAPKAPSFNWNPHGENAAANLGAAYAIYYTTDGSAPYPNGIRYTGPFASSSANIRAVAVEGNMRGPEVSQVFGLLKKDWKLHDVGSERGRQKGALAFDANEKTYWQSNGNPDNQFITIDLGGVHNLKAFAYTPQAQFPGGMMAKGTVQVSEDGHNWTNAGIFSFGNLVNDPSVRTFRFASPVNARFVKISCQEVEGSGVMLTVAELDFFE